jgi:hypothetical protein
VKILAPPPQDRQPVGPSEASFHSLASVLS